MGADKRAFSFLDLSFCDPVFIDWIKPEKKETLQHYALRLKAQITTPHPVIVGLSFGGMLAAEMALADPTVKAILVSSNKTTTAFPRILKTGKYLPLYKLIPASLFKKGVFIRRLFFSPRGSRQKEVFTAILRDSDFHFTKWAIEAILHWKNKTIPGNVIHIHGTADRLLPFRKVKADYAVKGGTHLMIMNNPDVISSLLKKVI